MLNQQMNQQMNQRLMREINILDMISVNYIRRAKKCIYRDTVDLNIPFQLFSFIFSLTLFCVYMSVASSLSIYFYSLSVGVLCISNMFRKLFDIRYHLIRNHGEYLFIQYMCQLSMLLAISTMDNKDDSTILAVDTIMTIHVFLINYYYFYGWALSKFSKVTGQDINEVIILVISRLMEQRIRNEEDEDTPHLTTAQINNLPNIQYNDELNIDSCSICLVDLEEGESLKQLPCNHVFHPECISVWLLQNITCPICRNELNINDTNN